MINEKQYKDRKSKTFNESITVNDKIMVHLKKPGSNKSTNKNKTDILIEIKGKIISFSICGEKFKNVIGSKFDIKTFKEQLLLLYSQKDCKDSNLTNPNKESYIQFFSSIDDDFYDNNNKKGNNIYSCYNKSNTFNSNFKMHNNIKTRSYKQIDIKFLNDINDNTNIENRILNNNELNNINNITKQYTHQICNICDLLKPSNKFIELENCKHTFCFNCGKNYYENLIEMGDLNLKCPFYKCSEEIANKEFLRNIISSQHYQRLIYGKCLDNNQIILKGKKTMSSINKGSIKISTLNSTLGKGITKVELNSILHKYSKKNVIHVTNNEEEYIIYTMFRDTVCPCCTLPCLFGKTLSNHLKCLNCLKRICKFCFRKVDTDHFNIYNQKCCKNYRFFLYKNKQNFKFNKKLFIKCENFGFIIISFILKLIVMYVFLFKIIDYIIPIDKKEYDYKNIQNKKTLLNFKSLTIKTTLFRRKEKGYYHSIKKKIKYCFNILFKIIFMWVPLLIYIISIPYLPFFHIIIEYFISDDI